MPSEGLNVAVVYALADRQEIVKVSVPTGTTVEAAVESSGLRRRYPGLQSMELNCAIYGRPVALTQIVREGDRIEILRPLLIDPKENRRQAAAKTKIKTR